MELREYFAPLIRWWWLLVLATLVAAGFSLVAGLQEPPTYRTTATLMIGRAIQDPNPDYFEIMLSQDLASTYADIALREPVREATMEALGLTWLPAYVVRPVPNTQLMEITVSDTDPVRAQAVANELSNQLIRQSPTNQLENQTRQEFISEQLDDLEIKINDTQDEIDAKQRELANLISARQIADAQNQIAALQAKLGTLQGNYAELLANSPKGALNTMMLIEPAPLPSAPVGPNVLLLVVTAAGFAFLVAVGAIYLLNYLDNSIKSPEEVKKISNLPVLAGIPKIEGEQVKDKLVTMDQPRSLIAESYRSLRTGLQYSVIDQPHNTSILITSPRPSDGKTLTAANLGVVLAQAGNKVLLMDADLHRPMLHRVFDLPNRTGLSDVYNFLSTHGNNKSLDTPLEMYAQATKVEGLKLLSSGALPPNPSELLGSNTSQRLLEDLKSRFDYIILDSPPSLVMTDALVISTQVDGVLIVIDAHKTPKNQLKESVEMLREVNANLLGVVINRLTSQPGSYYNYQNYRKTYDGHYGSTAAMERSNGRGAGILKKAGWKEIIPGRKVEKQKTKNP